MSTKIQQVVPEMSSTPVIGEPWNFNVVLEGYLIPRTVLSDKKLPPGARLLWGVIRQHCFQDGCCYASDETLARRLAVSDRQLRRYANALQSAGLLRTTARPGKTPIRVLIAEARFDGKIRPRADTSVRGGGQIRPGGRTDPSGTYKEDGLLNGVLKGKAGGDPKPVSPEDPELATRKPVRVMTEEEYRARGRAQGWPEHVIERDLERFRERRRNASAERMVKADELKPELEEVIRR